MGIVNKFVLRVREGYMDTLAKMFSHSTKMYEDNKMAEFLDGTMSYTYGSFHDTCIYESSRLKKYGVGAGEKIAILSQNMPNWTVAFFSAVAFGRIAVPILPDSSPTEIANILTHSSSRVLYVSQRLLDKIDEELLGRLALVIDIETLKIIHRDESAYTCDGRTSTPHPDDPAAIIYTSGTTGAAKGVMLSHKNLMTNVKIAYHTHRTGPRDRWLSILPMPHTYELSIGVLYPFYVGASVHYLQKPPSTSVLLPALKKVRPTVILSVPLVIEKVYRNSVLPILNQSKFLKWMDETLPRMLYWFIGLKLKSTFGGKLRFFGIGGSKLDEGVETFLKKARFPYAIGYGMTECAPLICTAGPKETCVGSTGRAAWGTSVRLYNTDSATGEGEIITKGDNVMLGYYKDAKRTQEAFTEDGWLRTGDLAAQDSKGRFYIRGRLKNLIIGPSGENIYPEEIEEVINNMDSVNESVVVERDGRLVALVLFNENVIDWNLKNADRLAERVEEAKKSVLNYVNKRLNKSSNVQSVEAVKEPFKKTATMKIRRFLYKGAKDGDSTVGCAGKDGVAVKSGVVVKNSVNGAEK